MTDARLTGAALRGAVDLTSLVRAAQTSAPGAPAPTSSAGAPIGGGVVRDVDDAAFGEIVELSRTVPVIVEFYGGGLAPSLGRIVAEYGGRLALATVDGNRSPQVAAAFQVAEVPAAAALVGGRPVQLFLGTPADDEVRQLLDQILELAAQNGVTGTVGPDPQGVDDAELVDEPLPPLHQDAYDAINDGDYATAASAYRAAIAQNPRDQLAVAGLAQVSLLQRLAGLDAAEVRAAGAAAPTEAEAQLAVADLDLSGGHVEDAFARLLAVFPALDAPGKAAVRTRLLDYFEIIGVDDPRTVAARRALTTLLY